MKWDLLTYVIQCAGMIVPLVGIVSLLKREQTKVSTYLLLTNIGCLITNAGYLLLISSLNSREAHLAYKIEYLGNVMFYFFFVLFLVSYFGKKIPKLVLSFWIGYEGSQVTFLWLERHDDIMFDKLQFMAGNGIGIMHAHLDKGVMYQVRYAALSFILFGLLVFTMVRMYQMKEKTERGNLGRLAGAEFVVMFSLIITQVFEFEYDVVPVAASGAIWAIILGVIRGEFHVEDVGRSWLFEDMKDIFIIVDSDYGYLDANESAKKFFPELRFTLKRERIPEQIQQVFQNTKEELELKERHYVKRVVPIEENGKTEGYGMLLSDIHEQHLLMEALKQEKEKAEEANAAKSAFMSTMSHEIRTPMNAIVGMTDILLRSKLPDREKEYLTNIRSSGEALLSIINDILDFSKIESGKLEIIEDDYEPMSMLNDLSMIFLNRIAEKPVELLFDIDQRMPVKLHGDSLRIRQVIINIVNNAIKFTDNGYVKLTMEILQMNEEDIMLQFRVKDTGQGIKEEDISHLFGSFEQVDKEKNKYKEGTGLGLAISKQLVELMHGEISVQSVYGQGSEFVFTMPQKIVRQVQAAEIKNAAAEITVGGAMRSPWGQEMLCHLIQEYGLVYQDCSFECVREHKIDFFFTDQINLVSDELLAKMKEKGTTLCVVQNPMMDGTWDKEAVQINKPLYTLNFCQVINKESITFETATERLLNFTAPDAHILIVDDNEMNLKVAKGLLEPLKMQIDTAGDGKQALEKIQKETYDMVFMDHMMPVMDGIEAVQRLRQMEGEYYRKLPVIALTANAVSGAREEFLAAGMNDFVAKPIRIKEICSKITKWLPKDYLKEAEEPSGERGTADIQIEGLDVAEGLENCGTKELFISLLGDFYKLIELKAVKIEKCLADGLIRDYTIEVHALKNTARMIGAMELSADFYRLEQLGNAEDVESLRKETPAVLTLYRSYKPVLKPYAESSVEKKDVDKEDIVAVLLKIKDAMDCFDLDGADAALKELEEFRLPEHMQDQMETLRAYVADVAMEDVMKLTEEMAVGLEQETV